MTTTFKKAQIPAVSLYSGLSAAGTSLTVTPHPIDLQGNKITMAALQANPQITIDPKVAGYEEIIGFTGIIDNGDNTATFTGLIRGLASSDLATPGTGIQHGAGAIVVFSINPQDIARIAALENDQSFTGVNTFTKSPIIPDGATGKEAINYDDAAAMVSAGAPDASASVKGIAKLSVAPVSAADPIAVGDNDNRVSPVSLATVTADRVAALAGTGTPNSTNKYVTSDTAAGYQTTANIDTTTTLGTSDTKYPSQKAVKTYVDSRYKNYSAGDTLIIADDTSVGSITSATYIKIKEINLGAFSSGTLRIKFDLESLSGAYNVYGRIYKNGVAIGTERTVNTVGPTTFSEDISGWSPNDLIQIYAHSDGTHNETVLNFRIYGDSGILVAVPTVNI